MSGPGKPSNPTGTSVAGVPGWVPAVGNTLASLVSDIIYSDSTKKREKRAREWNRKQWDDQNKYNHPLEQMRRLKEAGLNPNLIYGSSPGQATGNAGQTHKGQAPEYRLNNPIGQGINTFFDTKVKQATSNNLDSLSTLNDVRTATEIQTKRLRGTEADLAKGTLNASMEIKQLEAKTQYQKLVQQELTTIAMSDKDKGIIARYAYETMEAKIKKDTASFMREVAALKAFMTSKGILPDSFKWAQILAMIPTAIPGAPETLGDHQGFKEWKKKQYQ